MKRYLTLLAALALTQSPMQAKANEMIAAGQEILQSNCAQCHEVTSKGKSPHRQAVEFRYLSRSYPVSQLAEALAEGIMSGHPDMPMFEFDSQQVEQIIAYLESIQQK
ncbi:c-type cytochrome [Pseudahrensia aquimaris]|uniref:C-type cytochrome n=1 Tax=Pseudahrensia aquimaris TaxID=744461 RepID=A0ABW3FAT9_9HYPH